jgi:hypothetical protein
MKTRYVLRVTAEYIQVKEGVSLLFSTKGNPEVREQITFADYRQQYILDDQTDPNGRVRARVGADLSSMIDRGAREARELAWQREDQHEDRPLTPSSYNTNAKPLYPDNDDD